MVALDANLIESGKEIKFSGIVRSEFLEDTDGLAILDAGPIKEWWITGFKPDEEMKVSTCSYTQGDSVSIGFFCQGLQELVEGQGWSWRTNLIF